MEKCRRFFTNAIIYKNQSFLEFQYKYPILLSDNDSKLEAIFIHLIAICTRFQDFMNNNNK